MKPPEDPECGCDTHLEGKHKLHVKDGVTKKGSLHVPGQAKLRTKSRDKALAKKLEEQRENLSILKK